MSKPISLSVDYTNQLAKLHGEAFDTGWSASDFQTHIENPLDDVQGIVDDGDITGFIVVRTQSDQSEILTIVVSQYQRGKGLGKILLSHAECQAHRSGAEIMLLEVAADNPAAQVLYQHAGYQRCGTRKGYYRRQKGRVDALLFQKHL